MKITIKPNVTRITFKMHVDGKEKVVAEFIRKEKIDNLLNDDGSIGQFLRGLRDSVNDPNTDGYKRQ